MAIVISALFVLIFFAVRASFSRPSRSRRAPLTEFEVAGYADGHNCAAALLQMLYPGTANLGVLFMGIVSAFHDSSNDLADSEQPASLPFEPFNNCGLHLVITLRDKSTVPN